MLQLVDCYREGITERRKVCRATGMTIATFHNADRARASRTAFAARARTRARGCALATLLSPVVNALTSTLAHPATEAPVAETTSN